MFILNNVRVSTEQNDIFFLRAPVMENNVW